MIFLETSNPINENDISEMEEALKISLPQEIKDHYLNYNGGYPENDIFRWNDGSTTTINAFASIKYDGFQRLEDNYKILVLTESYIPIAVLPFATDDGGNFFCASCRQHDFGHIYYFNNDHYDADNKLGAMVKIDESFNHFVNGLLKSV